MDTTTTQFQLKLSLSEQLAALLQEKAAAFGVPVTQFVKHLILKEVEKEEYPTFEASDWTNKRVKKALKEIDRAIKVDNVREFFKTL